MKKAKIMLSCLAVLAAVGGGLAFKAHKAFSGSLKCSILTHGCTVETYTTTDVGGITLYCTTFEGNTNDCPAYTVKFDE